MKSYLRSRTVAAISFLTLVTVLSACRGVDDDPDIIGDSGEVSLYLTDGPLEIVDELFIQLQAVQIKPVGADVIEVDLSDMAPIDLLTLQDGEREELLDEYDLAAGDYEWLRLVLADTGNTVRVTSGVYPLTIPDDQQDNLQINFNVELEDDDNLDLTIDFDLRKSLRSPSPNVYELHPSLRLVNSEDAGTIRGIVEDNLILDSDCENTGSDDTFAPNESIEAGNAVYIFSGAGATVQDIRGTSGDPVTTATVERNFQTDQYEFVAAYLPRGNYTLAFTCRTIRDHPETDDSIAMRFSDSVDVNLNGEEINDVVIEE